jgi:hypothetical protein
VRKALQSTTQYKANNSYIEEFQGMSSSSSNNPNDISDENFGLRSDISPSSRSLADRFEKERAALLYHRLSHDSTNELKVRARAEISMATLLQGVDENGDMAIYHNHGPYPIPYSDICRIDAKRKKLTKQQLLTIEKHYKNAMSFNKEDPEVNYQYALFIINEKPSTFFSKRKGVELLRYAAKNGHSRAQFAYAQCLA